ncbi:MAG: hypothetical protein ABJG68_12460 [Crocinitomicaceae bacterium]
MNLRKKILLLGLMIVAKSISYAAISPKASIRPLPLNIGQNEFLYKPILFENESLAITFKLEEYKRPGTATVIIYGVLKLINKTENNLSVQFRKEAFYNGNCTNCNSSENNVAISISPFSTKEGVIDNNENGLRIFHSFKSGESNKKLTNLNLIEVSIKKV